MYYTTLSIPFFLSEPIHLTHSEMRHHIVVIAVNGTSICKKNSVSHNLGSPVVPVVAPGLFNSPNTPAPGCKYHIVAIAAEA